MKDRIRKIRKDAGDSQQALADKLGMTRVFITQVETGANVFSDRTVRDFCRVYNVSEQWLRTGEGEPYVAVSENDELAEFFNSVMSDVDGSVRRRLLAALRKLPDSGWEAIDQLARDIVEAKKEDEG